jgi:hypothetical protein
MEGSNMKKIVMTAVAITAISATSAMAADPSTSFGVSGSVNSACTIATGAPFTINTGTINTDADGALSGVNTGTSAAVAITCNSAIAKINVSHTELVNGTAPADAGGFTKTITYVAKATIGLKDYAEGSDQPLGIVSDNLTVTASSLSAGANKPYAGTYNGAITVTLKPAG